MPTYLYDLNEKVHCKFERNDFFIGHPHFPHREDFNGVTEMAIKSKIRPQKMALITPLHCNLEVKTDHINKLFLDDVDRLLPSVDILFGIMGEYWWDKWDSSPYAHWKNKMIRLDMAVDLERYHRVKKKFNPPGKRGFLYIGNSSDARKGTDFLGRVMAQLPDYRKGWIGSGPEIPNVSRIATHASLTPEFMTKVAKDYDIFISPAIADPNPTTILESMSWGFPVACTPQSGYYENTYRKNIYLESLDKTLEVLLNLQYMDESELVFMADKAYDALSSDYSWEKFTSTINTHLFTSNDKN
jgi:glycosyltransferase involved in cell wall biosynthesis